MLMAVKLFVGFMGGSALLLLALYMAAKGITLAVLVTRDQYAQRKGKHRGF